MWLKNRYDKFNNCSLLQDQAINYNLFKNNYKQFNTLKYGVEVIKRSKTPAVIDHIELPIA